MITIIGSEVYVDDLNVGSVADAKANYPAHAQTIEAAWDAIQNPPVPEE